LSLISTKIFVTLNGILFIDKPHCTSLLNFTCDVVAGIKTKGTINYRIDIYIGSDNESKKISNLYLEKIKRWASKTFPEGYTLVKGEGYYDGISEDSILLHAFLTYDVVLKDQLEKLKRELKQEAILVIKSPVDFEVV